MGAASHREMPNLLRAGRPWSESQRYLIILCGACVIGLVLFKLARVGTEAPDSLTGRDFAVVFDAGSSGSRVHVLQFVKPSQGLHRLETEYFEQLKPGLSSYGDKAEEAADSLVPLLDFAAAKVPDAVLHKTPLIVRATAGLRMLPGEQAERILNAVARKLHKYNFKLQGGDEDVKIMDGEDEGIFAWLAVNFLLGRVGQDPELTVGTIDLGGGSTQVAYASKPSSHTNELTVGGQTYHIFTHSYLGFGLNTARDRVAHRDTGAASPCVPTSSTPPRLEVCRDAVQTFISNGFSKVRPPQELAPRKGERMPVFVLSFIYDVAEELGLLKQPLKADEPVMINMIDFDDAAQKACSKTLSTAADVLVDKSSRRKDEIKLICFDLVYISELLRKGYLRDKTEMLHTGKTIELNGKPIETQWPLGAGLMLV